MALLTAAGQSLRLFHGTFLTPEHRRPVHRHSAERAIPNRRGGSLRQGCPASRPRLLRCQFPEILADTIAAGVQATASLPLHREDGTLVGAIGFAWTEPTTFDAKLESALNAVADLCTATIEAR